MNVNLSNVSATNKASASDSSNKVDAENPESNGFFETLAGVFTDSQKAVAKSDVSDAAAETSEKAGKVVSASTQDESQEKVATDVGEEPSTESTDELLNQESATQSNTQTSKADVSGQVPNDEIRSAMGEGQQLLSRIGQANQTLTTDKTFADGGKVLPSEAVFDQASARQSALASSGSVASGDVSPFSDTQGRVLDANGLAETEVLQSVFPAHAQVADGESSGEKRISLDELQIIDTKLAQGKPLSQQELDVIEQLKTGELIADIPQQEMAQFVALPSDVKMAMVEHQHTHNQTRVAASAVAAQQAHQFVAQDMKHTAEQAGAQASVANTEKSALSAMPEALAAANLSPAGQVVSSAELSKKVMSAGLAASALKGATNLQDKPDPQHGLAGQIQAAVGQQNAAVQQQARADAAQQAQLPLQLTKEMANDQVAEKVQMMMSKNLKNLDIRLDPPELGRMHIRMTMNNDLANVHFTVANPQARDLVEQTLPRLREMLAQQGMQLADSSVQQQSSGQHQNGDTNAQRSAQGTQGRGFSGQSDENFDTDTNIDLNVVSKRDGISFYA